MGKILSAQEFAALPDDAPAPPPKKRIFTAAELAYLTPFELGSLCKANLAEFDASAAKGWVVNFTPLRLIREEMESRRDAAGDSDLFHCYLFAIRSRYGS